MIQTGLKYCRSSICVVGLALMFLVHGGTTGKPVMAQDSSQTQNSTAVQQCRENLKRINMALEMFSMDTNTKPDILTDDQVTLPNGKYFAEGYLKEPFHRPTPACRYSGTGLQANGKVTCAVHGLADGPNPKAVSVGKTPEAASARARTCRAQAKAISSLIAVWEAKKVELESKPDTWFDIAPDGSFHMGNSQVNLNEIAGDVKIFVCPEAAARFGPGYDKPSYRFFNFDNSGTWIKGSSPGSGKKGVVCIFESEGRVLGKQGVPGPDGTEESAHHD